MAGLFRGHLNEVRYKLGFKATFAHFPSILIKIVLF